jgi:hypothetical protein
MQQRHPALLDVALARNRSREEVAALLDAVPNRRPSCPAVPENIGAALRFPAGGEYMGLVADQSKWLCQTVSVAQLTSRCASHARVDGDAKTLREATGRETIDIAQAFLSYLVFEDESRSGAFANR